MNINFNNSNNNKYLILLFIVSIFSALVFLASYKDIQWVFANSQVSMKDEMNNMTKMQNQNMMMDSCQMQKMMMEQMNKTGMGMMMGPMMGMAQNMTMPCMMMAPMMIGNQTKMGVTPCLIIMDPSQMQKMMMEHMKDPKHLQMMMEQMNKTGMMMENTNK
jgi:hypothetical protein